MESRPAEEVKKALHALHESGQRQLAEIESNPRHHTKPWWQIDKTEHGTVVRVWLNKVAGNAAGLWTFEPTLDDDGRSIIHVMQSKHVDDGLRAEPVARWHVPGDIPDSTLVEVMSDLVGRRSAKATVARLERNRGPARLS